MMTKIAKKIMLIFSSFLFVLCLGIVGVLGWNTNKTVEATAAEPTVEFTGFGTYNNKTHEVYTSFDAVDLVFSGDFTAGTGALTSGSIMYTIPGGTAANFQYDWANINGCGTNVVELLCWKGAIVEDTVLNIQGGTVIGGQTLPELTFICKNGKWVKEGDPTVEFTGFGSLNNKAWGNGYDAVDLKFNGDFTAATEGLTSGSITLTNPNSTTNIITHYWANINNCGTNVVELLCSTGAAQNGAVLKIEEGTVIGGQTLPGLTFVLKDGTWTNEPTVEFTDFGTHNNTVWGNGYDAVDLKFNGDFTAATEGLTSGSITLTNPNSTTNIITHYWANINNCGTNVVELLCSTGAAQNGAVLKIEEGTVIGGQMLPELTLYMVDGEWRTYNPTVSFVGVRADQNNAAWEQSPTSHTATFLQFTDKEFSGEDMINTPNYVEGIYWTAPNSDTPNYFSNYWVTGSKDTIKLLNGITIEIPDGATLHVVGGTEFLGQVLPEVTLTMAYGQWYEEVPTSAEFHSISNNHVDGTNLAKMLRIQFSGATASTSGISAASTYALGNNLKLNGTSVNELGWLISHNATSAKINFEYASLPEFSDGVKQVKLELTEATVFGNIAIQPFAIYFNNETKQWQTDIYVTVEIANFVQVGNKGAWGGGYVENQKTVWLEFDIPLATTASAGDKSNNGNISSQLTIDDALVVNETNYYVAIYLRTFSNDKGSDTKTLELLFQNGTYANVPHAALLHIPAGTLFGDVVLGEVNLYYNATESKWQTEKPEPYVSGFTTEEGGSIRISSDGNNGLRFETHIGYDVYNSLVEKYGKNNVKMGTYILPAEYLILSGKSLEDYVRSYKDSGSAYILTVSTWNSAKGENGFYNGGENGTAKTDGYYMYYGTISNIQTKNYAENFIGVGYLWLTDESGDDWLYLTHDGSWSRNVYYIAREAYQDTATNYSEAQLKVIKGYLDKVAAFETTTESGAATLVDVSTVRSGRGDYAPASNCTDIVDAKSGIITLSAGAETDVCVIINGVKAGFIAQDETKYADLYAVKAKLFDEEDAASELNFGFAEPNQELYANGTDEFKSMFDGSTNVGSTASNIAKVTAQFDGNSARIWFQTADLCWSSSNSDTLVLNQSCLNTLKEIISDFRAQGVTNISLMSSVANTQTTKNFYVNGTWYNNAEAMAQVAGGETLDGMALGLVVLPGEEDYNTFLELQKEYFYQLALEVGNTVTAIEILNEMEGATNYRFHYEKGYLPAISKVAQAAMDICKAATDGVKAAGKNIKIAMPALMTVSELKDGDGNVTRYSSEDFVKAEYDYIKTRGTGDADDYFQIINMHPYVVLSSATSSTNYLYDEKDGLTVQTPAQMKERWLGYMNTMRAIFVDNGDAEKPVWITEFGLADYNGDCGAAINTQKWSDYRNNKILRQAQVYQAIYDAMITLPWLDTVMFFRLGDYEHSGDHGELSTCGEATYGVIDASGNLKDFGKYLYAIVNGVNVFTDSNYTALKELNSIVMPSGMKSITDFTTAVNGIY